LNPGGPKKLPSHTVIPRNPWFLYAAWLAASCLLFFKPLIALFHYSFNNDSASHIPIIPFIVAALLFLERRTLPGDCRLNLFAALPFLIASSVLAVSSAATGQVSSQPQLFFITLSWIFFSIAGFIGLFGRAAARSVWFSFGFLAFALPLPPGLLDRIIYLLQSGSATVAGWIFDASGTPNWRDGFVFHLPGWNIEIARECSGIRSSIALLILAVLVAHFSFSKFWKKVVFVAAGLLMMIIKNGVRIATLSLLAEYVNPKFLFGRLHHDGGVVFFLLGLALLVPIYYLLRRGDPVASAAPCREAAV
jgi:exosortase